MQKYLNWSRRLPKEVKLGWGLKGPKILTLGSWLDGEKTTIGQGRAYVKILETQSSVECLRMCKQFCTELFWWFRFSLWVECLLHLGAIQSLCVVWLLSQRFFKIILNLIQECLLICHGFYRHIWQDLTLVCGYTHPNSLLNAKNYISRLSQKGYDFPSTRCNNSGLWFEKASQWEEKENVRHPCCVWMWQMMYSQNWLF